MRGGVVLPADTGRRHARDDGRRGNGKPEQCNLESSTHERVLSLAALLLSAGHTLRSEFDGCQTQSSDSDIVFPLLKHVDIS